MIRVQEVVLPILREALPGVTVGSFAPDVDHREFPSVTVRRVGGTRHPSKPDELFFAEVSVAVFSAESVPAAEDLYEGVLEALYGSVAAQRAVAGVGYLHSVKELQGLMSVSSPYPDTWTVTGRLRFGVRPL